MMLWDKPEKQKEIVKYHAKCEAYQLSLMFGVGVLWGVLLMALGSGSI